jgi:hypothetical protein
MFGKPEKCRCALTRVEFLLAKPNVSVPDQPRSVFEGKVLVKSAIQFKRTYHALGVEVLSPTTPELSFCAEGPW